MNKNRKRNLSKMQNTRSNSCLFHHVTPILSVNFHRVSSYDLSQVVGLQNSDTEFVTSFWIIWLEQPNAFCLTAKKDLKIYIYNIKK